MSTTATAASLERYRAKNERCPACGRADVHVFYRVEGIPVHSCLLMNTRDEALNYPRRDLTLGFCRSCGFIYNTAFDPGVHEYSTKYEETQGFSPHFNTFASSLAERLVRSYDIRDKIVLEIGCGKGEFLALLCRLGPNQGIGVDPAYVPGRLEKDKHANLTFLQEFYGEDHAHLPADVVCCRHTLEHIAPTGEFVRTLRKTIGDRNEMLVFFEVPDVMRELREGAFWDMYYEHCSYFSQGSLARLFRNTAFDLVELYADYADQYLMLTATPAAGPTEPTLSQEDDLDQMRQAVDGFADVCAATMERWRRVVRDNLDRGKRTVVWGSGSKGVSFLTTLQLNEEIEYVVDINPHRHGKFMPGTGQRIVAPEMMVEYDPATIIVMNPVYCREIQGDLDRLGVRAELVGV